MVVVSIELYILLVELEEEVIKNMWYFINMINEVEGPIFMVLEKVEVPLKKGGTINSKDIIQNILKDIEQKEGDRVIEKKIR